MTGEVSLGGRTFTLRPFTLRENVKAYPLAQRLTTDGLIDRWVEAKGLLVVTEEEMGALVDLAFLACLAADPDLTQEDFDALPVTPPELLEAFLQARYATGGWRRPDPKKPAKPAGEGKGEPAPRRTSTSPASSPGSRGTSIKARNTGGGSRSRNGSKSGAGS